ncbi:MAG TPA: HigA family addiction module antitoxin [Tepidisphaeraceae bacterium]|nr:HigA family addiction module antitoxin [Tepidisphaeraceae bacterium]
MPTKMFKPAEAFHPGDFLRDELAERKLTQAAFAKAIGRPVQAINEIVNGRKSVTAETAKLIGAAFGTGPELWLNLQTAYDLFHAPDPDPAVRKRVVALCGT